MTLPERISEQTCDFESIQSLKPQVKSIGPYLGMIMTHYSIIKAVM